MTTLQLQLAVKAFQDGSINAAADSLGISQPNASHSIRKLEDELGFKIFIRKGKGVETTDQGAMFINHATRILREYRAIDTISEMERIPRLRLGNMNYTKAVDAYIEYCAENSNVPIADFACVNVSKDSGIEMLKDRKLDLVIILVLEDEINEIRKECEEENIELNILGSIPICIRLRENHPLMKNGKFEFSELENYPFIDYNHNNLKLNMYNKALSGEINCSYRITVDERDTRLKLCSETNAYTIGVPVSESMKKQYHLVNIPIESRRISLISLLQKDQLNSLDIQHYLSILYRHVNRD